MTSRAIGILARSRPTIIPHGNALRVSQLRLLATRTPQAAPTKQEQETLPWPRYLAIRKAKRRWELVSWSQFFIHTRQSPCLGEFCAFTKKIADILLSSQLVGLPCPGAEVMIISRATFCFSSRHSSKPTYHAHCTAALLRQPCFQALQHPSLVVFNILAIILPISWALIPSS